SFYFPPLSLPYHTPVITHLHPTYSFVLFFFTAPTTPDIYTLSLHDALPIYSLESLAQTHAEANLPRKTHERARRCFVVTGNAVLDRKSTRLNSSHGSISYAVFCLKKKKTTHQGIVNCSAMHGCCRRISWWLI